MRIGLSYSRCVRDIVEGRVDIQDVLVIIARTDFDPRDDLQWQSIWRGYHGYNAFSNPEWADFEDEDADRFRSVSIELFEMGKLHQPRKFGANPQRLPYYWLETVLIDSDIEKNPAAKLAWDQFQILAELSSIGISPTL
jgi:hypothetical protein